MAKDKRKPAAAVIQKDKEGAAKTEAEKEVKATPSAKPKEEVSQPEIPKSLNTAYLYRELQAVKQAVAEHGQQIAGIQEAMAQKRKPTANGKVQIRDKQTGKVYPSKNNAYRSLLRAGELKELVEKGLFGDVPEKNNFGWFALKRAWPDRFEEVKEQANA